MKRNIVIAAVTAAALVGGGTVAAYAGQGADDSAPARSGTDVRVADTGDDETVEVRHEADPAAKADTATRTGTVTDAITAALKHTPGTAVSADRDDDRPGAWEVDVVKNDGTQYTVRVSTGTGKVTGAHRDRDDDGREDLAALKGTNVDAREAARALASKGTVTEVDLDDDGPPAWSVDTPKGDWKVNAHTGKVTQDYDD